MEINVKMLVNKNVCDEGLRWFEKNFIKGKVDKVDHANIIKKLEEEKSSNECGMAWSEWLLKTFLLTGKSTSYYSNNKRCCVVPYVNGEIDGTIERWFLSGQASVRKEYKKGVLIQIVHLYY